MPFWILQLAELLAAVALADLSLHVDRGGLLVAGTAAFALLAITANGPIGLVRVVPRRLHVYAVCVVTVVFALAPILPQIRPDASGIIIIEFVAIGLFRLATLTNTVVTVRPPRASRSPGVGQAPAPAAAAPAADPSADPPGQGPASQPVLPGHAPDPSSGAMATPRSTAPPTTNDGASTTETAGRWISRQASAAVQHATIAAEAAALTAEKHKPAAKAQAGRAARSAGRLTGRLTRSAGTGTGSGSSPRSGPSGSAPESSTAACEPPEPPTPPTGAPTEVPNGAPTETAEIQGPEEPK
ncbi:MAG TPA: hypothetical protein VHY77_05500 [Acidimicrobiales bacterium]|nr:hypothetical protein [Acidimicrobiales bacterium]